MMDDTQADLLHEMSSHLLGHIQSCVKTRSQERKQEP